MSRDFKPLSTRNDLFLNFDQSSHVKPFRVPPSPHDHCSHNVVHLLQSKAVGKLSIKGEMYEYNAEDLQDLGEIGRGNYGTVSRMIHHESQTIMAVKMIRSTIDEKEQRQLLKELDIVMKTNDCQFIVKFFGAIFKEGDCWICMELMSTSMERLYKAVHNDLRVPFPEDILGKISVAVVKALDYLKRMLNIIHRDVKPSNMLVDNLGNIKLCDFGISGQLVNSIAKTRDAGCQPYMAPERIDPMAAKQGYDIRSDVWSLGLSLVEIVTGKFPYPVWNSIFEQLSEVVKGDPPHLTAEYHKNYSDHCIHFVNGCVTKDVDERPKYSELLLHPFIKKYESCPVDVAGWLRELKFQLPNGVFVEE